MCQEAADCCKEAGVELGALQNGETSDCAFLCASSAPCQHDTPPPVSPPSPGKLAMHFTLDCPLIPTTLVSTASLSRLQSNLAAVHEELTPAEKALSKTLQDQVFRWPQSEAGRQGREERDRGLKVQLLNFPVYPHHLVS